MIIAEFYGIMSQEYRNELDKKNNAVINELLNGMPDFIDDYYDHLVARGRSTTTIKSYLYEVNVFLRFMATVTKKDSVRDIIVTDLDLIRLPQIEKYIALSESGSPLKNTAKRRRLSVIKSIYKYFFATEAILTNPVIQLEGARLEEKEVIKLNENQVNALIECIVNQSGVKEHSKAYSEKLVYRDLAIVMVLLGTGMRVSELVGLNLNDFDLTTPDDPCFHIIRKGSDEDVVYFVPAVKSAVSDYIADTRPLLADSEDETALFLSTQHKRMGVSSVEKMVKKYCSAAGLPSNISPHKLRATFATTVYKQTKDIYAVKDALHHKSIDTSKHYIGDKEERKRSAALAAGTMFS